MVKVWQNTLHRHGKTLIVTERTRYLIYIVVMCIRELKKK